MKGNISETTNEVEIEFWKWFNIPEREWKAPPTKFEALLEGFVAGWKAHVKVDDNED